MLLLLHGAVDQIASLSTSRCVLGQHGRTDIVHASDYAAELRVYRFLGIQLSTGLCKPHSTVCSTCYTAENVLLNKVLVPWLIKQTPGAGKRPIKSPAIISRSKSSVIRPVPRLPNPDRLCRHIACRQATSVIPFPGEKIHNNLHMGTLSGPGTGFLSFFSF